MSEKYFESQVVSWIVQELGYAKAHPNIVNKNTGLVDHHIIEFIESTQRQEWKAILDKHYYGDRAVMEKEFIAEVHKYTHSSNNVLANMGCTFIANARALPFKFKGQSFYFYKKPTLDGDDFNKYAVIQQVRIQVGPNSIKVPDVVLYLNGFPFAILQLKCLSSRQSAAAEGREQLIHDYIDTVKLDLDGGSRLITHLLPSAFYSAMAIHIAMDATEVYSIRNFSHKYVEIKTALQGSKTGPVFLKQMVESVLREPDAPLSVTSADPNTFAWQRVLHRLFNKTALYHEFIYNRVGKNSSNNNTALPWVPRQRQVYGVQKVMQYIKDVYLTEHIPNYACQQLKAYLSQCGTPDKDADRILKNRALHRNGLDYFSVLLQYAPGAGKSEIISMLSSQLVNLMECEILPKERTLNKTDNMFDKLILLTDRIDLRAQLGNTITDAKISQKSIMEVQSKKQLRQAIANPAIRVILVNIQKFTNSLEWASVIKGAATRLAILIDEVHRSNTGTQHSDMMDTFDAITRSTKQDSNSANQTVKHMIIGLTATPTEDSLVKFGHIPLSGTCSPQALDSYTFDDAVRDKCILQPLENLIPLASAFEFSDQGPVNRSYMYEHSERVEQLSQIMAKFMKTVTFNSIGKRGKAMVACSSIKAAKLYHAYLTQAFKDQDIHADIYIVYTAGEREVLAHTLCGTVNEVATIEAYRKSNNAVIIVVDKLQTGFDEPKLHTLFLDKDVNGVGAVQAACRVNRTAKGKDTCYIIDCSIGGHNMESIPKAFAEFNGLKSASLIVENKVAKLEDAYREIFKHVEFSSRFSQFKAARTDADIMRVLSSMEAYLHGCKANVTEGVVEEGATYTVRELIQLSNKINGYLTLASTLHALTILKTAQPKYLDDKLLSFMKRWLNSTSAMRLAKIFDEDEIDVDDVSLKLLSVGWVEPIRVEISKVDVEPVPTRSKREELKQQGLGVYNDALKELQESTVGSIEEFKRKYHFIFACVFNLDFNTECRDRATLQGHVFDVLNDADCNKFDIKSAFSTISIFKRYLTATCQAIQLFGEGSPAILDFVLKSNFLMYVFEDYITFIKLQNFNTKNLEAFEFDVKKVLKNYQM